MKLACGMMMDVMTKAPKGAKLQTTGEIAYEMKDQLTQSMHCLAAASST